MKSDGKYDSPAIWFPLAMAGLALDLWILLYIVFKWDSETGRPLPTLGYLIGALSGLVVVIFLYQILTGLFRPLQEKQSMN